MRNYQFWIALAIYLIAFVLWPLDRRDAAGFVTALFPPTGLGHGLGYAIAAGVVSIGAAWMTWSFARGSHEVPVAATVICWIGFGLLLNWIGLAVVAAGMTVLAVLSRNRAPDDKTRSTLDWKRGILQSALSLDRGCRPGSFGAHPARAGILRVSSRRTNDAHSSGAAATRPPCTTEPVRQPYLVD